MGSSTLDWNEHTGGTSMGFSSRHYMTNAGGCWGDQCIQWNSNTVTWTSGDTNWPKGWLVSTVNSNCYPLGGTSGAQYPALSPGRFHVPYLALGHGTYTNMCSIAATNWKTWTEVTTLDLHVVASTRSLQWILLSATATQVNLSWKEQSIGVDYATNGVNPTNILLFGKPLNADGKIFRSFLVDTFPLTPTVLGTTNYKYDVSIETHKEVPLSWVYHQRFHTFGQPVPTLGTWQEKYDEGARVLAADDDAKITDDDPSVAASTNGASLYRNDDVPVYVEFALTNGPTNLCVFTKTMLPVIPSVNATNDPYFHVKFANHLTDLHSVSGNIKVVKDITLTGTNGVPTTVIGSTGAIPQNPPSFVVAEAAAGWELVHEWGHACGIYHRRETVGGTVPNPANYDVYAIMKPGDATGISGKKINRAERDLMNAY